MPPVPVLKPREVIKAFEKLGWEVARQRGSHIILTKTGHIATLSIPNHPEVARGTRHAAQPHRASGSVRRGILARPGEMTPIPCGSGAPGQADPRPSH